MFLQTKSRTTSSSSSWTRYCHHVFIGIWILSLSYQLVSLVFFTTGYDQHSIQHLQNSSSFDSPQFASSEAHFFVMAQSTSCSLSITNNTVNCCPPPYQNIPRKSKLTAFLLSFFLGVLGVDRFYLGFYLMGVIKLLTIGGCGVWWLLDWILVLANSVTDVRGCSMLDDITPTN